MGVDSGIDNIIDNGDMDSGLDNSDVDSGIDNIIDNGDVNSGFNSDVDSGIDNISQWRCG